MNRPRSWQIIAGVATLLILHLGLSLWSVARQSITVDEIFHLTGGYCFNQLRDYRIHPDNGVLPQRLHALPAILSGAKPPPLEGNAAWENLEVGVVSYQFNYQSGNDHWPLLMQARIINAMFSLAVALLVFFWARALAGDGAGIVALALASFSPTLLAHGPLATTDMAAALFLNASVGAFWLQLWRPGIRWMAVSAGLFGAACVSKYSAVLLVPIMLALSALYFAVAPRETRRPRHLVASLVVHAIAAWVIIWACFGFRFAMFAPGLPGPDNFVPIWNALLEQAGWQGHAIRWMRDHRVLPGGFLWGYTQTYLGSLLRGAFLAGEYSNTGWPAFFPLAFLWKSTPAELGGFAAVMIAAGLYWRRLPPWLVRTAPLLALAAVYGIVAIRSHLNIGQRHLLPLYPILFIAIGGLVSRVASRQRAGIVLAVCVVGAQALSAVRMFPHYLAYFNVFAGGPTNGRRLLVDSSLDWGQDLSRVKPWLDRHNPGPDAKPVYLSYFGSGEPAYYDIQARRLPFVNGFKITPPFVRLEAGIYLISATTLAQVYSPFRGPWTAEFEREFQEVRALEPLLDEYAHNPRRRAELEIDVPAEQWRRGWMRYDLLRFARLCHYLRERAPDDHLGYSILIYRLDRGEISAATAGSLDDWRRLIERNSVAGK